MIKDSGKVILRQGFNTGPTIVEDHNPSSDAGYNPVTYQQIRSTDKTSSSHPYGGDQKFRTEGFALLTVLLIMTIMTIIGIAAIRVTSLGNRLAGFSRTSEAAVAAAEFCTGTAVNIIQQTIDQGSVPATFLDNANPIGPVPQNNQAVLTQEIMGQSDNNTDNQRRRGIRH